MSGVSLIFTKTTIGMFRMGLVRIKLYKEYRKAKAI